MKKIIFISVGLAVISLMGFLFYELSQSELQEAILGAPISTFVPNVYPIIDSTYNLGSSTDAFLKGYFDELCLTADSCKTAWPSGGGSAYDAWTHPIAGESATTSVINLNGGFNSSASSTLLLANIFKISNLTGNGFIKTSGGNGTLSIDTSTYLTSAITSLGGLSGATQTFSTANADWLTISSAGTAHKFQQKNSPLKKRPLKNLNYKLNL